MVIFFWGRDMKKFLITILLFFAVSITNNNVESGSGDGVAAGIAAGVFTGLATGAIANSNRRSDDVQRANDRTDQLRREQDQEKIDRLRRELDLQKTRDLMEGRDRPSPITYFLIILVIALSMAVLGLGFLISKKRQ